MKAYSNACKQKSALERANAPRGKNKKEIKMKKFLAIALAALMLLSFAACGETEVESLSAAYDKYAAQYPADGADGVLTVALSPDFAPMEFYDLAKNGTDAIVGFDPLLAKYLATEMGYTLELKPMSFDACQAAVQSGKVDIAISGFSWTADREQNYEITNYYIAGDNETEQSIICLKENEGKWTTPEDFAGLKIAYQGASLQEVLVKSTFGDMADVDITTVYSDLGTAVEALKAGNIDALAVAHGNGESIIASAPDDIAFTGFDFEVDPKYENNVCLIQKGNTELLNKVNALLDAALENDLYSGWYDASKVYAGVSTLDELGFDDEGNKIEE